MPEASSQAFHYIANHQLQASVHFTGLPLPFFDFFNTGILSFFFIPAHFASRYAGVWRGIFTHSSKFDKSLQCGVLCFADRFQKIEPGTRADSFRGDNILFACELQREGQAPKRLSCVMLAAWPSIVVSKFVVRRDASTILPFRSWKTTGRSVCSWAF